MPTDSKRSMLRHTLATLAYRAGKVLRGAPEQLAELRIGPETRTPAQILAHMGDLMEWARSMAAGEHLWRDSEPLDWNEEVARFFAALERFDDYLASEARLEISEERLFQGPVADALWHTGQLAMLRRLASSPIRGENYSRSEIETGRVGPDQARPRREFD